DLIVLGRGADTHGGRYARRRADLAGGPVVPGGRDRRDAHRAQVVDEGLVCLAVARRAEEPLAQAQVDRGKGMGVAHDIDALEGGEDVGAVRADARGKAVAIQESGEL